MPSVAQLALSFLAVAQTPREVPVAEEPSHHKVFENSYVRVFRVTIPANRSSLLHRHDLDYLYVSLGPADIINAVAGKAEIRPKLVDGQLGYAKGGFAHVATAVGMPFNNVTIELLRPQSAEQNLCAQVVPGGPGSICNRFTGAKDQTFSLEPQMETSEMDVDLVKFDGQRSESPLRPESLLVSLDDPGIQVNLSGSPGKALRKGEVAWIGPDPHGDVSNPGGKLCRYLQLTFKDNDPKGKS
jgi:hypothetical protein